MISVDCCRFFLLFSSPIFFFYCFTALIHVNVDRPEANREVLVFPLKEIGWVKIGTSYYGHYIVITMDARFFLDDRTIEHYKARVFANHQVLLTIPFWPYCPLHNQEEIVEKVVCNVTDAIWTTPATHMKKTRHLAGGITSCSNSRQGTSCRRK
jgi:hypothetical protein